MKLTKKAIEFRLKEKVDNWLTRFGDGLLRQTIDQHYILTGGAIVSLLLGEEPNDYDIYFDNLDVCKLVAEHYCNPTSYSTVCHYFPVSVNTISIKNRQPAVPGTLSIASIKNPNEDDPFEVDVPPAIGSYYGKKQKNTSGPGNLVNVSSNAISLDNGIQIITRICGGPSDIHSTFDFVHCVSYYTPETGLVLNRFAMESILTKELKYLGSDYATHSIFRLAKFIERGWSITQPEMLKIAVDIMRSPFTKKGLEHQLQTGLNSPWNKFIEGLPDDLDLKELSRKDFFKIIDGE
jgi:hypothetical protein